jgi:hypothetical protein
MMETTVAGLYVGDGMYLGRESFDALKAGQKRGREMLANALTDIATKHGASVERKHSSATRGYCGQSIDLRIACKGVGAMIDINDLHGGEWVLIHWFNADHEGHKFTSRFGTVVGSGGNGRPHHKATSHPRDWYSLAMMLDGGLQLAARGEAFEAKSDERSAT